jgi:hypothetical protein
VSIYFDRRRANQSAKLPQFAEKVLAMNDDSTMVSPAIGFDPNRDKYFAYKSRNKKPTG